MRRAFVGGLEGLCAVLDGVPTLERDKGKLRWFKGGWGCRIGVARWAFALDEHWNSGWFK